MFALFGYRLILNIVTNRNFLYLTLVWPHQLAILSRYHISLGHSHSICIHTLMILVSISIMCFFWLWMLRTLGMVELMPALHISSSSSIGGTKMWSQLVSNFSVTGLWRHALKTFIQTELNRQLQCSLNSTSSQIGISNPIGIGNSISIGSSIGIGIVTLPEHSIILQTLRFVPQCSNGCLTLVKECPNWNWQEGCYIQISTWYDNAEGIRVQHPVQNICYQRIHDTDISFGTSRIANNFIDWVTSHWLSTAALIGQVQTANHTTGHQQTLDKWSIGRNCLHPFCRSTCPPSTTDSSIEVDMHRTNIRIIPVELCKR